MVYRNTRTLKTPNFNHKLLILWLITGGLEYFFMDRKYVRMFLSLERTFWRTFFKKIFFLGVHLLAHSALHCSYFSQLRPRNQRNILIKISIILRLILFACALFIRCASCAPFDNIFCFVIRIIIHYQ